jgi:hypothetical protein
MEGEVYFVDEQSLLKLVAFGPYEGNKGSPPLRAILEDRVFTCEYYLGNRIGDKADIYFPQRNYILADEYPLVHLAEYVDSLINCGEEFIMNVGEGSGNERAFIWKRENKFFSKRFKTEKAIRVIDWRQIYRAVQAYNELVTIKSLPMSRQIEKTDEEVDVDISKQIQSLFFLESSLTKIDRKDK